MRRRLINLKLGHLLLGFAVTVAASAAFVSVGHSVAIPGGGPASSDCYVVLNAPAVTVAVTNKGKELDCTDGDPTCDADGACNNVCQIQADLCVLQSGITGCTPPASLKQVKFNSHPVTFTWNPPAGLTASACGAFVTANIPVKVSKKGKKSPGVLNVSGSATAVKGTKPAKDKDKYIIKCLPRVGTCPTPPPPPVCGDGVVAGLEQCDPPGQRGQCGSNQFCNLSCQCVTQAACDCGQTTPTQLKFVTSVNQLTCGHGDSSGGALVDLPCGTLWFGGGIVPTSLPNAQPDLGVSFEKITQCSGTVFGLTNTTAAESGSSRTCTTAGCTFGAPLPVPNEVVPAVSTCVVNVVAQNAAGFGDCAAGAININLPLDSRIHLGGGDLLNDDPNVPYTQGIQSCPICVDDSGFKCKGGPNDGLACTPETSGLGAGYPTSQDCPPKASDYLGSLSVPFALTTGVATKTASTLGGQANAFCGFCRDSETTAFQGTPVNPGDPAGPPVPCKSNADCTDPVFESCQQKEGGAFNFPSVSTITETGTAAGNLRDGLPHSATLVSVFCLPPAYNALVDGSAGLPGPGATALPGDAQLIP